MTTNREGAHRLVLMFSAEIAATVLLQHTTDTNNEENIKALTQPHKFVQTTFFLPTLIRRSTSSPASVSMFTRVSSGNRLILPRIRSEIRG